MKIPGTKTGLLHRVLQCLCASFSIYYMISTPKFFTISAFCVLVASMCLQAVWSSGLAYLDAYSLVKKESLQGPLLICFFMIGDMVTALLSFAGASSSAGIVIYLSHDSENCTRMGIICQKYMTSVGLAFFSYILAALSSLTMVWVLAAAR